MKIVKKKRGNVSEVVNIDFTKKKIETIKSGKISTKKTIKDLVSPTKKVEDDIIGMFKYTKQLTHDKIGTKVKFFQYWQQKSFQEELQKSMKKYKKMDLYYLDENDIHIFIFPNNNLVFKIFYKRGSLKKPGHFIYNEESLPQEVFELN